MLPYLSVSYVMSNGYKPAPLDLSHVKLTPNQNQLVEKLAENGHNVWARDRVRQGWTYSIVQVMISQSLVDLLFTGGLSVLKYTINHLQSHALHIFFFSI